MENTTEEFFEGCFWKLLAVFLIILTIIIVDKCENSQSFLMKKGQFFTYLKKYPDGKYKEVAYDSIYKSLTSKKIEFNIKEFYNRINNQPIKGTRIEGPLKDFLYKYLENLHSQYGWNEYISIADESDLRDAYKKIEEIENEMWGTEQIAWNTVSRTDIAALYKKYLELYPSGKHFAEAKKKYIQLSISDDMNVEHNELPSMDRISSGGSSANIKIKNHTAYSLTVFYDGISSETIHVPANKSGVIKLKEGIYRISARVSSPSVRPCVGTEDVRGGGYEVTYYISNH